MGSSVSPIVCNSYMESFEHRYVDDTHTVLKKIHSQEFTDNHWNSVDDNIKLTTEGEFVIKAPSDGSAMVGEDMSIRVERALALKVQSIRRSEKICPQEPATKKYPVVLPYVRGSSEQLRGVFRSVNIPAYFKPTNILQQLLSTAQG